MANEVAKDDKELMATDFDVNGQSVKLTANTVKNFLVNGNGKITDQEALMFISLCKYQHLNPFLNEAYLIKFGDSPAQIIVSKDAFMKRAEQSKNYNGIKAGCIVVRDKEVIYTDGAFTLPTDELVGGWANVFRDDRKAPIYIEISYSEFVKTKYGKPTATWAAMPANMIRKTAIVNALREAFPQDLGAMYTEEDANTQDSTSDVNKAPHSQPKKNLDDLVGDVPDKPETDNKPVKDVTPEPVTEETDNSMSDEEAKRAYEEIKNGGIDEDVEPEGESNPEPDGQTDLFK
ncbi:phage recombination protein Bet [Companilactobacillus baiquanensis]|uniref:Phage recombination protein Bet n=1 Tax=Companilactobacillus baiquanensis TaxID=2486005 RepID=A0ABW1UX44_9LACO|nr:phage recombination protein Bet [Companilactobacillus baiquanensis]